MFPYVPIPNSSCRTGFAMGPESMLVLFQETNEFSCPFGHFYGNRIWFTDFSELSEQEPVTFSCISWPQLGPFRGLYIQDFSTVHPYSCWNMARSWVLEENDMRHSCGIVHTAICITSRYYEYGSYKEYFYFPHMEGSADS